MSEVTGSLGVREKANLLRWILESGDANEHSYAEQFAEHMKHATYDYRTDIVTTIGGHEIQCTTYWSCIEYWEALGLPSTPDCLKG